MYCYSSNEVSFFYLCRDILITKIVSKIIAIILRIITLYIHIIVFIEAYLQKLFDTSLIG